jgi:hypothetical protein
VRPSACTRVTAVLAAYAEDVALADSRIAALEADLTIAQDRIARLESDAGAYRELTCPAFDGLCRLTVKLQTLTNENHQLRDQNRALFEELHLRCDAGVWANVEEFEGALE